MTRLRFELVERFGRHVVGSLESSLAKLRSCAASSSVAQMLVEGISAGVGSPQPTKVLVKSHSDVAADAGIAVDWEEVHQPGKPQTLNQVGRHSALESEILA